MSFPILRSDLNDVNSDKLNLELLDSLQKSTFIERRVVNLSKQIIEAALEGKKNVTLTIVMPENVEPVSSGLKVNFPDVSFDVQTTELEDNRPKKPTNVVVDWTV
jgi:hypothetical protein